MLHIHGPWVIVLILFLIFGTAKALQLNGRLKRSQSELRKELCERMRTEAALRQSEERYRGLFEHLSLGLFQTTLDGRLVRANRALAAGAGFASPQEMVASVRDVGSEFYVCPSLRAVVLSRVVQSPEPISYEALFRRKTGEEVAARVTLRLVHGEQGQEPYLEGSIEDITEGKRLLEFATAQRDLGAQLAAASGLGQVLPLCLETAIHVGGMDCGEIYLVDRDSGAVVLAAGVGFRSECLQRTQSYAELNVTILTTVAQPTYTQHEGPCEVGRQAGCDATMRSRAIIPILHKGAIIGWLVMKSHTAPQVSALSRGALEGIATHIGGAIVRIQAQEALSASRSQLRSLFDSLNDFLFVVDSRGYILETNRAGIERVGYTRQELHGKRIAEVLSPDPETQRAVRMPDASRGETDLIRVTLVTKDGTTVPVEVKLALGVWEEQRVVIAMGRDLTERLRADERAVSLREKTALLKEIHHRVKNNLQVVASLLSLQASQMTGSQDSQPFRESQARVHAIALLHERLYQAQDLSRIELGEYLGALAQHILRADLGAICLRLEADAVWLSQDTAMPCGLIVNELITNSCKYAFPGGSGEIYLSVKQSPDGKLLLRVGDNGVGLPAGLDLRNPATLGLQLVDDMVSQLRGSWTVESSPGTLFQVVLPVEAV